MYMKSLSLLLDGFSSSQLEVDDSIFESSQPIKFDFTKIETLERPANVYQQYIKFP